ncbi:ferric reductase-like transmembrane domain-containing protein [Marivita sp. S6314]|uniref:ferric reductase-like transmembrane domain-containing protein n=1 Tax=Marivita sp. S6314 TaxID=2926406 RepID=UPI001FF14EED|nr:ferric reductase-like transmembrane domain-containing protein [Marivita sp. S6314]MCK0149836.1 ferric reductase-like transmembrane domain-containing protein [Marivita sp. S6314]
MATNTGSRTRALAVWAGLLGVAVAPIALAATSPYLAWRDPIYIVAGFAGIIGFALILFQPLLALGGLPGLSQIHSRQIHRWIGAGLVLSVLTHVIGLWITSPPDVLDALLFRSPTPFSAWGVFGMWALFATAALAATRTRFRQNLRAWRMAHSMLACVIVIGTVVHAALIEGTMETLSRTVLSAMALAALAYALLRLRVWKRSRSSKRSA